MTESKKGNMYIISEMVLWSLFPVVSLLGLKGLSPLVSFFWVNAFAVVFFLVLMIVKNKWYELKDKQVWYYTFGVVLFICVIFFGLYFYALSKTLPANAAIVAMFEIIPTYIFFQIIKKEKFDSRHAIGVILGIVGTLIVLLPSAGHFRSGDLIILIATLFPPIGNWYQQKVRKIASTYTLLFLRHLLTVPFLLVIIWSMGDSINAYAIKPVLGWILLNGMIIFGLSKIFWIEAIHRMTVTKALAINGLNPILTVFFAWLILSQLPTTTQLVSIPFLVVSILILTDFKFSRNENEAIPNNLVD